MKKLLFLLLVPAVLFSQDWPSSEGLWTLTTNNDTTIASRTFTPISSDTTRGVAIDRFKTVKLVMAGYDSCSILSHYATSVDGTNWTAFTASDSLKVSTDITVGIKTIDLSSVVAGAKFVRLRLQHSDAAYARGTGVPKYSAFLQLLVN